MLLLIFLPFEVSALKLFFISSYLQIVRSRSMCEVFITPMSSCIFLETFWQDSLCMFLNVYLICADYCVRAKSRLPTPCVASIHT